MDLGTYLKKTNCSVYRLSKNCGVPYTTLLCICRRKAKIDDCRVGTLRKIAASLHVSPFDLLNSSLSLPVHHHFINDSIALDINSLPQMLRNSVKELEDYDAAKDSLFYDAADTMLIMADRFLAEGVIDKKTYELLAEKYPIA
jgi:hypothetical protein